MKTLWVWVRNDDIGCSFGDPQCAPGESFLILLLDQSYHGSCLPFLPSDLVSNL